MNINWKHKKEKTIFFKTFGPVLSILLIVMGLFTIIIHENILQYLKINETSVFDEQVKNKALYLDNQMNGRWTEINNSMEHVVHKIEEIVKREGKELSDIETDWELNQKILGEVMEDIIGTLRACDTTEIFLILDGYGIKNRKEEVKAGLYLRNNDPDSYIGNNGNLLLERGVPSISKKWLLPLDSFWEAGFTIGDETDSNSYFFTKPLAASRASENKDFLNFSYWCFSRPIDVNDKGILTYSIPMIATDGTVIGVMGVGISEEHFTKGVDYKELGSNRMGAYMLAKTQDGKNFEPIIVSGASYNKSSYVGQTFKLSDLNGSNIFYMRSRQEEKLCVSKQNIRLYNNNTPFEQEQWALLGVLREDELLAPFMSAQKMLLLMLLAGGSFSVVGVFWTSRLITKPIKRLVEELRKSNPNKPIELHRLYVEEIDELIISIETLSYRVAEAFSRISDIIQLSESGIGVFEYKEKENVVFCSRGFYELLGWGACQESNAYVDGTDFSQRMSELMTKRIPGEEDLYEIVVNGRTKWLKLNETRDEISILGVLTDATASVLEKRQIEYERDYDLLTNLCNRRAFEDQMKLLFQRPDQLKHAALVVWDIDNLKYVNDTYGHTTGDNYIIAFADCLKFFVGRNNISARRSGDEFMSLVYGYDSTEAVAGAVAQIWNRVQEASIILPSGNSYKVRVSAGKAWYPKDADNFETLFQFADFTMYTVKHSHRGTLEDFDTNLYKENKILLQGQEEFHNLLDNRLVHYVLQPIMRVADGSIYGYEMLMRSQVAAFRSPLDILRMAHAQSKLYDLEVLTWFEAMKTYARLCEYGMVENDSKVFINSIANQMMQPDISELFRRTFTQYLPRLVCEFTEEEQDNAGIRHEKMELMKNWFAMIALDDYGCGYNSESILLDTAPDIVKIDMSIVRGIDQDESRTRLVENLVLYARERGIMVLGEGVETKAELGTLIRLGVDLLQGYYLARPSDDGAAPPKQVCDEVTGYYQKYFGGK